MPISSDEEESIARLPENKSVLFSQGWCNPWSENNCTICFLTLSFKKIIVLVSTLHSLHGWCISCAYLFTSISCQDTAAYREDNFTKQILWNLRNTKYFTSPDFNEDQPIVLPKVWLFMKHCFALFRYLDSSRFSKSPRGTLESAKYLAESRFLISRQCNCQFQTIQDLIVGWWDDGIAEAMITRPVIKNTRSPNNSHMFHLGELSSFLQIQKIRYDTINLNTVQCWFC